MIHHISYRYNALLEYYPLHRTNSGWMTDHTADGIIHRIEVWWVRWPHVWHYGLSFSNVCMRPEFMTSVRCDSVYCMCFCMIISKLPWAEISHACLCSCQWRTFWTNSVTIISLFSLYLMNFMFYTMLCAACNIQRVHYKSMKSVPSYPMVPVGLGPGPPSLRGPPNSRCVNFFTSLLTYLISVTTVYTFHWLNK